MDLFDALADDPELNMSMKLLSGDVQLVHNHTLLHDRTAFEDWPEPERKRHLLRLWLAPPEARPLPYVFAERYGALMPGDRGGVILRRQANGAARLIADRRLPAADHTHLGHISQNVGPTTNHSRRSARENRAVQASPSFDSSAVFDRIVAK